MIDELLKEGTLILTIASGVRLATPYLFAAVGEMFGQRSGVVNLGDGGRAPVIEECMGRGRPGRAGPARRDAHSAGRRDSWRGGSLG